MVTTAALQGLARRWRLRLLRQFGPAGLAGLALMAAATLLVALGPRLQESADSTRGALQARRHALAAPPSAPAPQETLSEQEQLERFVGTFPPLAQNANDMAEVFASAERAHVNLVKGDYTLRADAGSPFVAYSASFPVREPYAAVKAFAANVLGALPHAALDEMRMGRTDTGGTVLDASVRFTFIYRRP